MSKKWLVQALILSSLFNLVVIGLFFFFLVRDNPLSFTFPPSMETECTSISFNREFTTLSMEKLVELLLDERMLENGYRVRDLALGVLVSMHHLDLERALDRPFSQTRVALQEDTLLIFPGLNQKDFQNISRFIQQEKWPFTTKGIFYEITKEGMDAVDTHLLTFFCHCPEFVVLETLFAKGHVPIQKGTLLKMVLEGGWDRLEHYFKGQQKRSDFSDRRRQALLLDYLGGGAQTAAHLLLLTDFDFVTHELDDEGVEQLLDLATDKSAEVRAFLESIVSSERSAVLRQKASRSLENCLGVPEEEVAANYFPRPSIGELRPKFRDTSPISQPPQVHVIQPGDSLWLIARKYRLSVETLMEYNQLHSTVIRPGKTLKIPRS